MKRPKRKAPAVRPGQSKKQISKHNDSTDFDARLIALGNLKPRVENNPDASVPHYDILFEPEDSTFKVILMTGPDEFKVIESFDDPDDAYFRFVELGGDV